MDPERARRIVDLSPVATCIRKLPYEGPRGDCRLLAKFVVDFGEDARIQLWSSDGSCGSSATPLMFGVSGEEVDRFERTVRAHGGCPPEGFSPETRQHLRDCIEACDHETFEEAFAVVRVADGSDETDPASRSA